MTKHILAVALASTLLAGCQSIFGHQARLDVRPVGESAPAASETALAEGRAALLRGEVGSAITSLRLAAMSPASAAAAHNGLGVAYAMLGRPDVAERYFQRAVLEAPTEARYSANLARFYAAQDSALAIAPIAAPQTEVASQSADVAQGPAVELAALGQQFDRVVRTTGGSVTIGAPLQVTGMSRVSATEVAIRTSSEPPARSVARVRTAQAYPVRIDLSAARGQ